MCRRDARAAVEREIEDNQDHGFLPDSGMGLHALPKTNNPLAGSIPASVLGNIVQIIPMRGAVLCKLRNLASRAPRRRLRRNGSNPWSQ